MQEKYLNSLNKILVEIKRRNPSFDAVDALKSLIIRLIHEYSPKTVIIAGSLAAGRWIRGRSDIDILIVSDAIKGERLSRRTVIENIDGIDVQISVFTEEEVLTAMNNLNFFFISAIHDGIPVYGADHFRKLREELRKVMEKYNIRRYEHHWEFK